jgi:hypothetical protein
MKYLMFVCSDPSAEPYRQELDTIGEWVGEYDASGIRLMGDRLLPSDQARTIRLRGEVPQVSVGALATGAPALAGFDVLDCDSWEQAIEVALKHPMARFGQLELRQVWPFTL